MWFGCYNIDGSHTTEFAVQHAQGFVTLGTIPVSALYASAVQQDAVTVREQRTLLVHTVTDFVSRRGSAIQTRLVDRQEVQ